MDDMNQNEQDDTSRPTDPRPLGYWLRTVDGLLTREFADTLESEGVTRRDWMLLNVLSGDIDAPGLRERLARKGKRLRGLEDRGWAQEQGDGTWVLTDQGTAEKERIAQLVEGIRARVLGAVGDEQYAALTGSLEAIARELGWDESAAGTARGFGFGRPGFGPAGQFGPGFGGRPGPFGRDFRFGGNRHRGFAPGRPGHPAERFDDPYRGFADDGCPGHHPYAGHSHRDHEGGHPHAHGGEDGRHHAGHGHGHGHGHGQHGHHGEHRHGGRGSQRAYERGFDAGFSRGREAGAA